MADKLTPEQRHKCMSSIRSRNTKPEVLVRKYLFAQGLRFRINVRRLPGTPDIVLRKYRTVIFVNGCFWHGHEGCRYFVLPKTRTDFWQAKIERNRERDLAERLQLRRMGWHVIQVWECQLKPKNREPKPYFPSELFRLQGETLWRAGRRQRRGDGGGREKRILTIKPSHLTEHRNTKKAS